MDQFYAFLGNKSAGQNTLGRDGHLEAVSPFRTQQAHAPASRYPVRQVPRSASPRRRARQKSAKAEYGRIHGATAEVHQGTEIYSALQHRENLTSEGKQSLKLLLKANKRLNAAYLLRESFDQLWDYTSEAWARRFFDNWKAQLRWQRLEGHNEKFAAMIESATGTASLPIASLKTRSTSASSRASTTRSGSSSAEPTACTTRNTSNSKTPRLKLAGNMTIGQNRPLKNAKSPFSDACSTYAGWLYPNSIYSLPFIAEMSNYRSLKDRPEAHASLSQTGGPRYGRFLAPGDPGRCRLCHAFAACRSRLCARPVTQDHHAVRSGRVRGFRRAGTCGQPPASKASVTAASSWKTAREPAAGSDSLGSNRRPPDGA